MAGITILSGKGAQNRDFTTWQDKAYRIGCFVLIAGGLIGILQGMNVIETAEKSRTFLGVSGGIQFFFALMLLWEQTWAQFVMKWYLILAVLMGILNFPMLMLALAVRPALAGALLLANLIQVSIQGFMLYLIHTSGDA